MLIVLTKKQDWEVFRCDKNLDDRVWEDDIWNYEVMDANAWENQIWGDYVLDDINWNKNVIIALRLES